MSHLDTGPLAEPNMPLRRRSVLALAIGLAACLAPTSAQAQSAPASTFEGGPTAVHLVGHEEAELLRRIQDVIDEHDPRKLRNPYVETVTAADPRHERYGKKAIRRSDLLQFIADPDAAEALGKAFFWEMQAGSDFRRQPGPDGKTLYLGTACASCHYRFGADARDTNTTRIPYVAWIKYPLDPRHPDLGYGEKQQDYDIAKVAVRQIKTHQDLLEEANHLFPPPSRRNLAREGDEGEGDDNEDRRKTSFSLIVGSQGVEPRVFRFLKVGNQPAPGDGLWWSEHSEPRDPSGFVRPPEWSMFLQNQNPTLRTFRQITNRNTPTVINAAFSDRLFHDVRAESTFNGFSIFGDFDPREVIHVRRVDAAGNPLAPVAIRVAIPRAALASQAVGPIVNDVEMSYVGRTFHDLAAKLLKAPVLGYQAVSPNDSHLGRFRQIAADNPAPGLGQTYSELIKKAFRREWWDGRDANDHEQPVELGLSIVDGGQKLPTGTLMDANFSLYWGLSLMLYQASLVSNDSPYDQMLRGRSEGVEALWALKRKQLEPIHLDRIHNQARKGEACVPGTTPPKGSLASPPKPADAPPPFLLLSGSEVFQRGLRAFRSRGCVDCHDGPLFSEIYSQNDQGEFGEIKSLPIAKQIRDTLLPNARADAISFVYQKAQEQTFARLSTLIGSVGAPNPPIRRELLDYAALIARVGGNQRELATGVAAILRASRLAPPTRVETPDELKAREAKITELAEKIAGVWTPFEKTFPNRLGNRHYFTEDERVAFANDLVAPLFVEPMLIPQKFADFRPVWPVLGPKARRPVAFYDTSVYALGVAPPRYDLGAGNWTAIADSIKPPVYTVAILRDFETFLDKLINAFKDKTPPQPAEFLEQSILEFDKITHPKYGMIMRKDVRQRVRDAIRPGVIPGKSLEDLKQMAVVMRQRLESPTAPRLAAAMAPTPGGVRPLEGLTVGTRSSSTSGARGNAYRLDAPTGKGVEHTEAGSGNPKKKEAEGAFDPRRPGDTVYGPWSLARDADADGRAAHPRDLSWHRNLPNWNDEPDLDQSGKPYDDLDVRRADVHFFARSRALVQDESPQGRRKPFLVDEELAFWGAFKTPTLRNVALTPPYMHNGRLQTLYDVLDFYDRGGDVAADRTLNPDLHPAMTRLGMDEEDKLAVVFFLMCLTDSRVEREKAPFDHPSLVVVNGYEPQGSDFREKTIAVGPVGAVGRSGAPRTFPNGDDQIQP